MSRAEGGGARALLRDYRRFAGGRFWVAAALMLLGALAEGFGLLMIVPLASIAIGGAAAPLGPASSIFQMIPGSSRLVFALALFVGFMAARSALLYARQVTLARLEAGYESSLRLRAISTLAARGWPFASRVGQAGMQSLLLNDVSRASRAIDFAQQFAVAAVMLAVQLALATFLSPVLALIALAVLAAGSILAVGWSRRGAASGMALAEHFANSTRSGFRLHAGLKAALAQGSVAQFIAEYKATLGVAREELVRFARDLNASRQLAALAAALAAALLLFVGMRVLHLPFPILIASLALFARMATPALNLQQSAHSFSAHAPSFIAILQRLGGIEPLPRAQPEREPLQWCELEVRDATFEHQPGLGLQPVSLALRPGEWIGIAGPSGAGKTTLIDLVVGLLEPSEGEISIDGSRLEGSTLDRWRAALAYVGQDGTVFNDSVRANLNAGREPADDDALRRVLDLVGLAERIRSFPQGLEQDVGDRGSQLSGGERQRLVLARGLLRAPSLLILDEATAALDPESEARLLERLRQLEPRPAALIVAHRQSTLAHCDSVISIRHRFGESGDLKELAR